MKYFIIRDLFTNEMDRLTEGEYNKMKKDENIYFEVINIIYE